MKYLIYFILVTSFMFAQFDWADNGIPIRQGYHIEWYRGGDISSDGNMIIVWSDTRTSTRDVYAQKVDENGNILWTGDPDGVLVAGGEGRQEDPIIISDGNGGGFISWRSYQNDPVYGELYAQYIDSNGNLEEWSSAQLISGDIKIKIDSQQNMCSDKQGGVYVTWYADSGADDGNYYGTHLAYDGTIAGPIALIETEDNFGNVSLESAGSGDAVIAWKEGTSGSENIYAQRVSLTLEKLWNSAQPVEVCTAGGSQSSPKVTYYSNQYVVVVWEDWRSSAAKIGGNFIDVNGSLSFSSDNNADIVYDTGVSSPLFPRVKATFEGAFVVWLSATDVHYVQKMTPDNLNVWNSPTSLETGQTQEKARLSADGNGGVFITWVDDNSIVVEHLNSDGNSSSQTTLSDIDTEQFSPLVRADGNNGAYIVWADGALNNNGIGSLILQYEYIQSSSGSGFGNGPSEIIYGFGGQIEAGTTRSLKFDDNNNLIYWQDYRNGVNQPQTYGSFGGETVNFETVKLLSEYPNQQSPQIVRAGENTLFMGFSNQDFEVYYQRLNNNLNPIGDAAPVNDTGNEQTSSESPPFLFSNGNGDVYYSYSEVGNIYLQKYNSTGENVWSSPKLIVSSANGIVQNIFSTNDGGCIIIHDYVVFPNKHVKLTRIDSDGNIVNDWDNIFISLEGEDYKRRYEDAVATDDGVFVVWRDVDVKNIFAKHIPFNSADPSSLEILTISSEANSVSSSLSIDYSLELNEVLACWQAVVGEVYDINCSTIDIASQHVSPTILYPDLQHSQKNPSVIATEHSTFLVTWEDERWGNYSDLYVKEITSSGQGVGSLGNNSTVLCNAGFNQYNFPLDAIQDQDIYLSYWEDDRSSGKEFVTNIFAQKINPLDCSSIGDLNGDTGFNVLDIVTLANCVLNENCATLEFGCAADINGDTYYNVLDIVTLANCVLNEDCSSRVDDASYSKLIIRDNIVLIEADGFIGGVQMTLQHGDDFTIEMTDMALHADYLTSSNETRLLVITPETDELFSFSGDFEITEIIVANSQYEVSVDLPLATSYSLSEAYPNPFNPTTTMTLTMPVSGDIRVEVYNLLGQVVSTLASGYMEGGTYTLTWDASDVSSGMYFVKAQTEGFTKTQKLMLVK